MTREPFAAKKRSSEPAKDEEPLAEGAAVPEPQVEKLRPSRMDDVIGQRPVVERLKVLLDAAKMRKVALPHILFDGPPGLGKTTLATVLPRELGVDVILTSGPALSNPKDLMPYLTNLTENAVLFIDEIHRMPRAVEEFVYPAMEDFRIDIVLGEGLGARTLSMPLKQFTLIGATTRSGMLSGPMRDRFQIREHLDYYTDEELTRLVIRNAGKLRVTLDEPSAIEIARRARGTPRIANSHLYWVHNYSTSRAGGKVSLEITQAALAMQEIDAEGLDRQDRRYLETLVRVFGGGPTGVEALAATMNVAVDTLSEDVEPFLLRREYIIRTPRGRRATTRGFQHVGVAVGPTSGQLF